MYSWYSWYVVSFVWAFTTCTVVDSDEGLIVFHYNQHNGITSLDPAFAKSQNNVWSVNHLYSTLVQLDDSLVVQPAIAKSWEVSEDALTYTFHLRSDVLFHADSCFENEHQRKVTAQDVAYSYLRLLDEQLNPPGSWIFKDRVSKSDGFRVYNDTLFAVHLSKPFAPLLSLLTMQYCSIVPKEAVEYYGSEFYRHPVGTGPFTFIKWVENEGLFLSKNPSYFEWIANEPSTNVDVVRTSFIGERSIALLELLNDRIDFFSGIESSYINTVLKGDGTLRAGFDEIRFLKSPFLNFEYLGLNPKAPDAHPLLRQLKFRQALNYGIDRRSMLESLRNNIGKAADAGVIPRGLPSYDPEKVVGYTYDKTKALMLLSEFDRNDLDNELIISTSKDYLDLTTFIARQWDDLGLNTRIEVMESSALRDAMRRGAVSLFRASWIADYPDGESFLSMFYSSHPAPPNYTRFQSLQFDVLYEDALEEDDPLQKGLKYQQMDRILVEQAPVVFLFYDEAALFADSEISGLSQNALNLLQVKNLWIN